MSDTYFCYGCLKHHKGEPASTRRGRPRCHQCQKNFAPESDVVATMSDGHTFTRGQQKRSHFNHNTKQFRNGKLDWLKYT